MDKYHVDLQISEINDSISAIRDYISDIEDDMDEDNVETCTGKITDLLDNIESDIESLDDEIKEFIDEIKDEQREAQDIKEEFELFNDGVNSNSLYVVHTPTMLDIEKMKLLEAMFDKYTLWELNHIFDNAPQKIKDGLSTGQLRMF